MANKYGARKAIYDGIKFDSILERDYYIYLKLKKKAGLIKDFETQKRVDLKVNGQLVCYMRIDFYIIVNDRDVAYHDTKGVVTALFRLKAKLFKALIGKEVRVIKRQDFAF